jgi:hypothetical protein
MRIRNYLFCFGLLVVSFVRTALTQQPNPTSATPAPAMTKQQALERAAAYDAALKMLGASG